MAELETVNVLFTDLVDSTALATRVGSVVAAQLRHEHFAMLRDAIEATGGRQVKNLGDGVMAAFPSATAATACAVAIQQSVEQRNRRADQELHVRIGLSSGDAEAEDGDYFGRPIVEAARLCAHASGGEILCSDVIRLVGDRGNAEFSDIGPVDLKGLGEPLAACRVQWQPVPSVARLPLPPRIEEQRHTAFCGRRVEQDALGSLIARATSGTRRLAVVVGEPGIGKTALVADAARRAHDQGANVLYGRCSETPLLPYEPFVEALRHWIDQLDEGTRVEPLSSTELVRLLPGLGPTERESNSGDPVAQRYRLFEAVTDVLASLAAERPVVLVLDDLHWADPASELLLGHLLRSARPEPLAVLATVRDAGGSAVRALGRLAADLVREDLAEVIPLGPLPQGDLRDLVEATVGQSPSADFVAALHATTDGNCFFVKEMLRDLGRGPDGFWSSAASLSEAAIPHSVKSLIARRVDALGERPRSVLRSAAVIGRRFELSTLETVAGVGAADLVDDLDAALDAGLVIELGDEQESFAFAHALTREVLYEELSHARRALAHRAVGEALENRPAPRPLESLGALSHHFSQARGDEARRKAVSYGLAAGEQASAMLAYEDAARHYASARAAVDRHSREWAEISARLGEAQARTGEAEASRRSFDEAAQAARRHGDSRTLARAALGLAGGLTGFSPRGVADASVIAVLEEALDALDTEPSALRAQMLARLAVERYYADDQRRDGEPLAREGRAIARQIGDPAAELGALCALQYALLGPRVVEQLDAAEEIVALARRVDDRDMRFRGESFMVGPLLALGRAGDAEGKIATCSQLAQALRHPGYRWEVRVFEAMLALLRGKLADAERLAFEAHDLGQQIGQGSTALNQFGGQLFLLRWAQGRLEELAVAARQFAAEFPSVKEWQVGLPFLFAEMGALEDARAAFEAVAAQDFQDFPLDSSAWLFNMAVLASTCASLEDARRAAILYDMIEPYGGLYAVDLGGVPLALGSLESSLGMLATTTGRLDRAAEHFARAHERNAAIGAQPFGVLTVRHHLDLLARRRAPGDAVLAQTLQATASATCRQLGMPGLDRQIMAKSVLAPQPD